MKQFILKDSPFRVGSLVNEATETKDPMDIYKASRDILKQKKELESKLDSMQTEYESLIKNQFNIILSITQKSQLYLFFPNWNGKILE